MGASDFHDLDGIADEDLDNPALSNQAAFVRDIRGDDTSPDNLLRAIDTYVLSGAIKLFREITTGIPFKHHTMLVHSSHLNAEQRDLANLVRSTLRTAGYEAGDGLERLRQLLWNDFAPVSAARAPDFPMPAGFEELVPYIGKLLAKLWQEEPVLIVNGTNEAQDPDFDKRAVWRILVGGTKLSRGYTIEGLTVSYFRRRTTAGDTLMQMGRWFGFRPGFKDLVRLFIGREEGHGGDFDICGAFEALCQDEEVFRRELQRYAMPKDGAEPVRPIEVPPSSSNSCTVAPTDES